MAKHREQESTRHLPRSSSLCTVLYGSFGYDNDRVMVMHEGMVQGGDFDCFAGLDSYEQNFKQWEQFLVADLLAGRLTSMSPQCCR